MEELLRLLAHARTCSERDFLMMSLAFTHGLRASEITGLTVADVRDGYITVQRLKGSLRTTQQLLAHENPLLNCRVALPEFVRGMIAEQRIFPVCRQTFWRRAQRYALAIGLPAHKRNTKMLKHTCALISLQLGVGIENVRQHLGHKSLSSTGAYLRVTDEAASAEIARALGTRCDLKT